MNTATPAHHRTFADKVAGTDPWAPSLEGTIPAPKGWEELPGGWKLHYRVPLPRRASDGLVKAMRAEIGEERWAQLQRDWVNPHFEADLQGRAG